MFFRKAGLDDSGRRVFLEAFGDEWNPEFIMVLVADRQRATQIGLSKVLPEAPNAYWRSAAIQTQLDDSNRRATVTEVYAGEPLWAVGQVGRADPLGEVMALVDRRCDEVLVANRTVLCLETLEARDQLNSIRNGPSRLATELIGVNTLEPQL